MIYNTGLLGFVTAFRQTFCCLVQHVETNEHTVFNRAKHQDRERSEETTLPLREESRMGHDILAFVAFNPSPLWLGWGNASCTLALPVTGLV